MSMLVTMVASIFFFSQRPTLQLLLGILTATTSLQLYYMRVESLVLPQPKEAHVQPGHGMV